MTSLSDEDCPFSEYERRAQASVIDVLSPNLSQTRLFPKFTLLEQHQPYRSLAGILGGKNVGTPMPASAATISPPGSFRSNVAILGSSLSSMRFDLVVTFAA